MGARAACQLSTLGMFTTIIPSRPLPVPVNLRIRRPLGGGDALCVEAEDEAAVEAEVEVPPGFVAGVFPCASGAVAAALFAPDEVAVTAGFAPAEVALGAGAPLGTVTETVEPPPPPPPQPDNGAIANEARMIAPNLGGKLLIENPPSISLLDP
jgi:hypothetical protein